MGVCCGDGLVDMMGGCLDGVVVAGGSAGIVGTPFLLGNRLWRRGPTLGEFNQFLASVHALQSNGHVKPFAVAQVAERHTPAARVDTKHVFECVHRRDIATAKRQYFVPVANFSTGYWVSLCSWYSP